MKRIVIFIFITVFLKGGWIQAQDIEITQVPFNFQRKPFNIIGIDQDPQGYLWFVDAEVGLFRYDGTDIINLRPDPANSNSVSSDRIECIHISDNGIIWLGHYTLGLDRYNPETGEFIHYKHDPNNPNSIRSDNIRTLSEDTNGNLWIGTETGLDKMEIATGRFIHDLTDDAAEDILDKEHIRALYIDSEGIVWVGSGSPFGGETTLGGLFRYDDSTKKMIRYVHNDDENSLIDNRVRAIFEDSRGTFWIGTAGDGLHTLDRETGLFTRHRYDADNPTKLSRSALGDFLNYADDHITFINEDVNGHIWIGTFEGGISRFDPISKVTYRYSSEAEEAFRIPFESYWWSYRSADGLLWFSIWDIGVGDQGILKVNSQPVNFNFVAIPECERVFETYSMDNGDSYITALNGLWHRNLSGDMEHLISMDAPSFRPGMREIEEGEPGELWISSYEGLYMYNTNRKTYSRFVHDPNDPNSISNNQVQTFKYLGNNQLLLGMRAGLNLLNTKTGKSRSIPYVDYNDSDPNGSPMIYEPRVEAIERDRNGNIWIGTFNSNLILLNSDLDSLIAKPIGTRLNTGITDIHLDGKERLWVASEAMGIRQLQENSGDFVPLLDSSQFLSLYSSINAINEDHNGSLWLLLDESLLKINPESGKTNLYGESWGISNDNLTGWSQTSRNGDIFYGGDSGYFKIDPNNIPQPSRQFEKPFINQFILENQIEAIGNLNNPRLSTTNLTSIELDHDENNFAFEIGHVNYISNISERRLQFKMEGYDPNWREVQAGDIVSYFNVSPGSFDFRIRALDLSGSWVESSTPVIISPPWYLTTWAHLLFGLIFFVSVYGVHSLQKARVLRKANNEAREKELEHAVEIKKAYTDLQNTQAQLVHSEKMASLGELTAGIAHEIQNPLNFVNNFSEVSSELIQDMKDEIKKGNTSEILEIADDLDNNLGKIHHHGERASSIVKSMLQHSRSSSDTKVETDINDLCDEFLRLSYHGLRARDKTFNVSFKTDFDKSIPEIPVVPQDIGRVLLNILNNAFYVVDQKKKSSENGYQPHVSVSTKRQSNDIEISIEDNGGGIPKELVDKIFQPFFTTKPTGKGTGLGLSLSYDIIKAHNGDLKVESEENKGTKFIISLPTSNNQTPDQS